jgi:hypothetical protein
MTAEIDQLVTTWAEAERRGDRDVLDDQIANIQCSLMADAAPNA